MVQNHDLGDDELGIPPKSIKKPSNTVSDVPVPLGSTQEHFSEPFPSISYEISDISGPDRLCGTPSGVLT